METFGIWRSIVSIGSPFIDSAGKIACRCVNLPFFQLEGQPTCLAIESSDQNHGHHGPRMSIHLVSRTLVHSILLPWHFRTAMKTLGQRRALLLRFRRFHSALTDSQRKTNREFLIYGANTDVGKTVVSAAVCRYGLTTGHPVTYIKPVQTGDDTDAGAVVKHAVQDAQNADLITET